MGLCQDKFDGRTQKRRWLSRRFKPENVLRFLAKFLTIDRRKIKTIVQESI
jgi:hypothetical protein